MTALLLLRQADDRHQILLLSGHEPTMSELVKQICGGRIAFPTAAVARVDLPPIPWRQQELTGGTLGWLVTPKLLRRAGWV